MFLSETKMKNKDIEGVGKKIGFHRGFYINNRIKSGGLGLF